MKLNKFAISADPDEVAHNKPPHLDLHCLPCCLLISLHDIGSLEYFCSLNVVVNSFVTLSAGEE